MKHLEKHLAEWKSLGIISGDQVSLILAHEKSKPESSWILSGLLILGVVIVGIGVISLIASNWSDIPDEVKLLADFAILGGLAWGALSAYDKKRAVVLEVLLVALSFMSLASIGLISQIYHAGGKLYMALFFWLAITGMSTLVARKAAMPFIWTGILLGSIVAYGLESPLAKKNYLEFVPQLFATCALLVAALALFAERLRLDDAPKRAFLGWTLLAGLTALGASEVVGLDHYYRQNTELGQIAGMYPVWILGAICAAGFYISGTLRSLQRTILLVTLVLFLLPFHISYLRIDFPMGLTSLAAASAAALFAASTQSRGIFQFLLSLIALRFLIFYFQAMGGLAMTGVGLIVSGGVVIGVAVLWNKYRKPVAAWAERMSQ